MTDEELIARLRRMDTWLFDTAADRIEQLVATNEALEAKLGYYNLLWQAYEGERPVEHLEEAVKNHSAVSDRLAEKLHEVESLLAKAVEALENVHRFGVITHPALATLAEIKGESHD